MIRSSLANHYQTEGIILKRQVYKEASLLCRALSSEFGLITMIANGAVKEKSSFTGLLEPFNQLTLELYRTKRTEIYTIKSAGMIKSLSEKIGYQKNLLFNAAAELVLQIDFLTADSELYYQLFVNYLIFLRESTINPFLVFVRFTLRILSLMGIPLELTCQSCNSGRVTHFYPQEDSFICANCSRDRMPTESITIRDSSVATLENIYNLNNDSVRDVNRALIDDYSAILLTHLSNHFNKRFHLKSLRDY